VEFVRTLGAPHVMWLQGSDSFVACRSDSAPVLPLLRRSSSLLGGGSLGRVLRVQSELSRQLAHVSALFCRST
jgi:hypothetical protein